MSFTAMTMSTACSGVVIGYDQYIHSKGHDMIVLAELCRRKITFFWLLAY